MTETIYLIYQTTNLVNGKTYIGQHKTTNINDGYLGTGQNIKRALKKYGKENFKREILFTFDNFDDMNDKEIELVSEEFIALDTNYNLKTGGANGKYSNESKRKMSETRKNLISKMNQDERKKLTAAWFSESAITKREKTLSSLRKTKQWSEMCSRNGSKRKNTTMKQETKLKIGIANKGKPRSLELREHLSSVMKGVPKGKQNIIQCPHCFKVGGNAMKRWHFDNCPQIGNK